MNPLQAPSAKVVFIEAMKRINDKFTVGKPVTINSNEGLALFDQYEKTHNANLKTIMEYAEKNTEEKTLETLVQNCYTLTCRSIIRV